MQPAPAPRRRRALVFSTRIAGAIGGLIAAAGLAVAAYLTVQRRLSQRRRQTAPGAGEGPSAP